jgi:uncharacterized protein YjlB
MHDWITSHERIHVGRRQTQARQGRTLEGSTLTMAALDCIATPASMPTCLNAASAHLAEQFIGQAIKAPCQGGIVRVVMDEDYQSQQGRKRLRHLALKGDGCVINKACRPCKDTAMPV